MKTLLLGGTDLTLRLIKEIHAAGYPLAGVVSIERNFSISYNKKAVNSRFVDIEGCCQELGIAHTVYNKNVDDLMAFAAKAGADFCLVAGWYFMLPKRFRDMFVKGCAGIHASMLPELRGVSPVNWALLKGHAHSGVSMFEMTDAVDEGDLYGQVPFSIEGTDDITDLIRKVEEASVSLSLDVLKKLQAGTLQLQKQKGTPSYCCPRVPEDSYIDWKKDVDTIHTLVRASSRPYAGAYTHVGEKKVIIWKARPYAQRRIYGLPGQICMIAESPSPMILTGSGVLMIEEATLEDGEEAMSFLKKSNYQRCA